MSIEFLPVLKNSYFDYAVQVKKFPLLSKEEEIELILKYRETGEKSYIQKLILSSLRYVVMRAYVFRWRKDIKDIIQEGTVGLMYSVNKYDPTKNKKFSDYAQLWINAYIYDYLIKSSNMLSERGRAYRKIYFNFKEILHEILNIEDSSSEEDIIKNISEKYGMSYSSVKKAFDMIVNTKQESIDLMFNGIEDNKNFVDDFMELDEIECQKSEINEAFHQVLTEKEKEVLKLMYLSDEPKRQIDIAKEWGTSKQNIDCIKKNAIKKIKKYVMQ